MIPEGYTATGLPAIDTMNWSAPKRVSTRRGDRLLSTCPPDGRFWGEWKRSKEALQKAGISCINHGGWQACWWRDAGPEASQPKPTAEQEEFTQEHEARLAAVTAKLLPYQVDGVRRQVQAIIKHGGGLEASDTGTGKTFVTLAAAYVLDRTVFVCCPKAVIPSWKRAAEHFGMRLYGIGNYELLRRGTTPAVKLETDGKKEKFVWQLPPKTVVIFDEVHRLKSPKTQNCAMGMAALSQGFKVMGLSATAADNPMQMKFVGLLTKLFENEKRFFPWMLRNGVHKGTYGMHFNGSREVLSGIHKHIFPEHGSRIRIADLGDAFPETQISAEAYEVDGLAGHIAKIYEEMAAEIERIKASETADKGSCILVAQLRARQRAEVLKIPAIAEMAQDAIDEGMSVAVFVNFDASADALMEKLKTKCVIRGGQKPEEREACIAGFQADREHAIIANIKAGGVGVSLHGSKDSRMRLSIICPTFSGQDLKQALGRVWRANGAKSIQRIFFAAGTIEEDVCANVKEKIARIDTLNDGDLKVKGES